MITDSKALFGQTIKITDIEGVRIGNAEDAQNATGCTVIVCEDGAPCGVDVRGGGPASRETELLKPTAHAQAIHAVLLGGGSAFGLDAAGGVMRYLEEHGIGLDMGITRIPLVVQSDIFDLTVGSPSVRPDQEMGYRACENAWLGNYQDGNHGAGIGASVGKCLGMDFAMKSGVGSFATQIGELKIGAVVAVNSIGDVFSPSTGQRIAGLLANDKKSIRSTTQTLMAMTMAQAAGQNSEAGDASDQQNAGDEPEAIRKAECFEQEGVGNTTIGAIITNAKLDKTQLCKIASMAHNGYARCIDPVHTSMDGDTIYAMSTGKVQVQADIVGTLAAHVIAKAVENAVLNAEAAYGLPCASDII